MNVTADQLKACLKIVDEYVRSAAGALISGIDRMTFQMLVNCLKSEDPEAVKEAIDQLAREGRPAAIPPLYVVSVAHPHPWVRQQAKGGLKSLVEEAELEELTRGKDVQDAVRALIARFGHYKAKN